jgi:hypothetical protein
LFQSARPYERESTKVEARADPHVVSMHAPAWGETVLIRFVG